MSIHHFQKFPPAQFIVVCVCVSDKNTYEIYPLSKCLSVQCSIVNSRCSAVQESRTYSGEGLQVRRPLYLHLLPQVNVVPPSYLWPAEQMRPSQPRGEGSPDHHGGSISACSPPSFSSAVYRE